MGLIERFKIGFSLLIFVVIWGLIASVLTGLVSFPISLLLTAGLMQAAPTGIFANSVVITLLVWIIFLPLTALFFGLVTPLLPEKWFIKNWKKSKEMSVF